MCGAGNDSKLRVINGCFGPNGQWQLEFENLCDNLSILVDAARDIVYHSLRVKFDVVGYAQQTERIL